METDAAHQAASGYGPLLDGATADVAGRLDALDADRDASADQRSNDG